MVWAIIRLTNRANPGYNGTFMRIGAVNYLNSKPLVCDLQSLAPHARITYDLPSRLADSLAAGRLDVALVPVVEFFRTPSQRIVSDACVACEGPVLSVKLHFRVPPKDVRRVALDEGSRTSAALTKILLAEMCDVHPVWEPLPIGCGPDASDADAVLLIGDRAIADCCHEQALEADSTSANSGRDPQSANGVPFAEVWDLGERWWSWTGLPFVFAMWVARGDARIEDVAAALAAARDRGLEQLDEIAEREAPPLGIPSDVAKSYFRDNLHFALGRHELNGLRRFYELCVAHNLAPVGLERELRDLDFEHVCPK
jgi:chorismate dehydratase